MWCLISGLFALLMMVLYTVFYGKKNGFSAQDRGLCLSGEKLWKTIVLALLTACLAFLILFFAAYFFKTDFRLWMITLKTFSADKVLYGLRYLPFFLIFYIINSVSACCYNYNTIGGKANTLLFSLFNGAGALAFLLIQYIPFFAGGSLAWYDTEAMRISGIWLAPVIVYLWLTPYLNRIVYRKTKNPYLMGRGWHKIIHLQKCGLKKQQKIMML